MRLSIVLAINGIHTKPGIFGHRPACRLSIIGPIVTVSRLTFANVYSTICTKSIVISYKNRYTVYTMCLGHPPPWDSTHCDLKACPIP